MALCNYIRTNNRYCKNYCLYGVKQCHIHVQDDCCRQRLNFTQWVLLPLLFAASVFSAMDAFSITLLDHTKTPTPTLSITTSTLPFVEYDYLQTVTEKVSFHLTEMINTLNALFNTMFNC